MILQKKFSIDRSVIYFLYITLFHIRPIPSLSYLPIKLHPSYISVSWQLQTVWNGCCSMFKEFDFYFLSKFLFAKQFFAVLIIKLSSYWILADSLWMDTSYTPSLDILFYQVLLSISSLSLNIKFLMVMFLLHILPISEIRAFFQIVKRFFLRIELDEILSMAGEEKKEEC